MGAASEICGGEFLLNRHVENRFARHFRCVHIFKNEFEFFEKPFVLVLLRKVVEGKVHLLIFVVAVIVVVAGVVFFFHVAQFLHKLNGWVVFAGIVFLAWSHNEFL